MSEKPDEFDFNNYDEKSEREIISSDNRVIDILDYIFDTTIELFSGLYILGKRVYKNIKGAFDNELED